MAFDFKKEYKEFYMPARNAARETPTKKGASTSGASTCCMV